MTRMAMERWRMRSGYPEIKKGRARRPFDSVLLATFKNQPLRQEVGKYFCATVLPVHVQTMLPPPAVTGESTNAFPSIASFAFCGEVFENSAVILPPATVTVLT